MLLPVGQQRYIAACGDTEHIKAHPSDTIEPKGVNKNMKYISNGERKTYSKKGFATKKEARLHEAAVKNKLATPTYIPPTAAQRREMVRECLEGWIERHGSSKLRPSTKASYESHIRNHVLPYIGDVR